jgi:FKBP-type peptidyl-prolyl cis-trans isomerase SlyD
MITVGKDNVVSMRYVMKDSNGTVLENIFGAQPVSYLHGATGILALLQEQLTGMKAGDKKTVYLEAKSGLIGEDFTFEVVIDNVRPARREEILLGYPVQSAAAACDADCECHNLR